MPTSNPPRSGESTRDRATPGRTTRALLAGGAVAGPLYVTTSVILGLTRDGFDFTRHYWSLLENGELGWVQRASYGVSGLLLVAFALGLGRALDRGPARRWAPAGVGFLGASLVVAGLFTADSYGAFPLGATPETTGEGLLHVAALCLGSTTAAAACFVLARRFTTDGPLGLAGFSWVTGVVALVGVVPFAATFPSNDVNNVRFAAAAVLVLVWIAAVAAHLSRSAADAT